MLPFEYHFYTKKPPPLTTIATGPLTASFLITTCFIFLSYSTKG